MASTPDATRANWFNRHTQILERKDWDMVLSMGETAELLMKSAANAPHHVHDDFTGCGECSEFTTLWYDLYYELPTHWRTRIDSKMQSAGVAFPWFPGYRRW